MTTRVRRRQLRREALAEMAKTLRSKVCAEGDDDEDVRAALGALADEFEGRAVGRRGAPAARRVVAENTMPLWEGHPPS